MSGRSRTSLDLEAAPQVAATGGGSGSDPHLAASSTTMSESNDTKHHPDDEKTVATTAGAGANVEKGAIVEAGAHDPAFLVNFDGADDPENPKHWASPLRWYFVVVTSVYAALASFASSAPSNITGDMSKEFGLSIEVGTLAISVYLAGFVLGPLLWGPISESYGRRIPFIASCLGFTAFSVGASLAQNTTQMMIFRFLTGAFAACPMSNAPAVIGDVCHPHERALGVGIYTLAPLCGPALGPICSGFIHVTGTSWRWMYWVLTISGGVLSVVLGLTLRETYPPALLVLKAARLRRETGDPRWHAPSELVQISMGERIKGILVKPWAVFFAEPILVCIHIYIAFQYGIIYLVFESYPIVFGRDKGWNDGIASLPFLAIPVGGFLAVLALLLYFDPMFNKLSAELAPNHPPPEARLPPSQVGSVSFMISFFIFAWTAYPDITWVGPVIATVFQAYGVTSNFIALTAYIIDTYHQVTASALATNVVIRSAFGAGFPLFARQMYDTLNPRWATTVLGFIALALMPIPWLFVRYGPWLRSKSRYAPNKH
ncbi:MFS general substrate transporter [Clavulina sp. PMI_390]|nr:MFS general substrate transporter [Clavulina sp. PMI_390]